MAKIGTCWADESWNDAAWAFGTWAGAITAIEKPPSPTVLIHDKVDLLLVAIGDDGYHMSAPLIFTRTETGSQTFKCVGADGSVEDLLAATSVTFSMVNLNGTVKVNAVALSQLSSSGTGVWTKTSAQVDTAGDYIGAVRVLRSDGTIGVYPDAQRGMRITILPLITD